MKHFFDLFCYGPTKTETYVRHQVSFFLLRDSPPPSGCSASTGREIEQELWGNKKKDPIVPCIYIRCSNIIYTRHLVFYPRVKDSSQQMSQHFQTNCIREQYFYLSELLIGAYAVSLEDVTNSVFLWHVILHQRIQCCSVGYTSWRQPDQHYAVADQSSDHTTPSRADVCVLRTQINMASKHVAYSGLTRFFPHSPHKRVGTFNAFHRVLFIHFRPSLFSKSFSYPTNKIGYHTDYIQILRKSSPKFLCTNTHNFYEIWGTHSSWWRFRFSGMLRRVDR